MTNLERVWLFMAILAVIIPPYTGWIAYTADLMFLYVAATLYLEYKERKNDKL